MNMLTLHQTTTDEDVILNFRPDLFNRLLQRRDRMLREAEADREVLHHAYMEPDTAVGRLPPSGAGPSYRARIIQELRQRNGVIPVAPYIVLPDQYGFDPDMGVSSTMYVRKYEVFWLLSLGGGGQAFLELETVPLSWETIERFAAYIQRGEPLPNGGPIS